MKYKLVAIDMDGTLLNSNKEVSQRTKEAIEKAKEKGVYVVISTGRVLKSAFGYAKAIGLNSPVVACNGAVIVNENGEVIYKETLDCSKAKELYRLALEKEIYYHFYDEDNFYSHMEVEEVIRYYNEGNSNISVDVKIFNEIGEVLEDEMNIYKFIFIDNDEDKLMDFRKALNEIEDINICSSWSNNVEAMNLKVSKGEAISELCKMLQIKPEEVIAIGDSENDLSMLQFAGLGVVMGNGEDEIKKYADYITDTNDEDGVAKVIEKFILGEV